MLHGKHPPGRASGEFDITVGLKLRTEGGLDIENEESSPSNSRSLGVDEKFQERQEVPREEAMLGPLASRGKRRRKVSGEVGKESLSSERLRENQERLGRELWPPKGLHTHELLL